MANVFATRTGVWSATATWNTSALPTINDDVYANNFTIYVDDNFRVISVRNTAATGINAGGRFILNDNVSLSAFAVGGGATGVYCVQFLSAAPFFSSLVGNLCANNTAIAHPCVILNNSSGTLSVIGNFIPSSNNGVNSSSAFILNNSSGVLNLSGNYFGGLTSGIIGIINGSTGITNLVGSLSCFVTNAVSNALNNNSTGTVNITGNLFGFGDASNGARAAQNNSTGTINIIGDVYGPGAFNQSTGTINITGNCFGRTSASSHAIQNSSFGTITILGNTLGGSGNGALGILNNSGGTVYITGNVIGGTGNGARGAQNNATGYMEVNGLAIGNGWGLGSVGIGGTAPGVLGSQTGTTIIRGLSCGARGQWPTEGNVFIIPQSTSTATFETSAFQDVVLFTSLSTNIVPPASSVRLGTRYNLNDYTGTCVIPSISSVLQGVAVDNSIGIAALQPQTIWNYSVLSATDIDSLGGRLKEVATVQSVGQQLTALN